MSFCINNIHTPLVSVVLPVHNGEYFLADAIKSIEQQTLSDWELILINDGSTDRTSEIAHSFLDKRIRVIDFSENKGCYPARNYGLTLSKGKYVAAMDSDDVCFPDRLEKQVAFLEQNKEIGLLGTAYRYSNMLMPQYKETDPERIKLLQIRHCYLRHPTCMIRRALIIQYKLYYNEYFVYAGDYDWQVRACHYFPVSNLNEVLLTYRRHENQISASKIIQQGKYADIIRLRQIQQLGGNIPKTYTHDILLFFKGEKVGEQFYPFIEGYVNLMYENNRYSCCYNQQLLKEMINVLKNKQAN